MILDSAILDSQHWARLEKQAIEEGLIDSYQELVGDNPEYKLPGRGGYDPWYWSDQYLTRGNNKDRLGLLRYLAIFDQIDGPYSEFDLSKLTELGIVNRNGAAVNSHQIRTSYPEPDVALASKAASLVSRYILREVLTKEAAIELLPELTLRYRERAWQAALERMNENPLEFYNEVWLNNIEQYLFSLFVPLVDSLQVSCDTGATVVSTICRDSLLPELPITEDIENLYVLIKTKLSGEIRYLPDPRSISEAVDLRDKIEMRDFRQVLVRWLESLQEGTLETEKVIREDLANANRSLRRVKGIKEYKQSPLNFWINAVGGHIPILSNVIAVTHTAMDLYSSRASKKYRWSTLVL